MRVVHINNSQETFTASSSGAIATHIWEVCRAAIHLGERPLVISKDAPEPPLPDVPCVWLPEFRAPVSRLGVLALRARKKWGGWRGREQPAYKEQVERCIRTRGLQTAKLILHNDPELAACVRRSFPRARILLHFHNPIPCAVRYTRVLRQADIELTAVSAYVAGEIRRLYGRDCNRVVLNGVDSSAFFPVARSQRERPEICFLGRTGVEKGADLFLKACVLLAAEGLRFGVRLIGSNHWGRWQRDAYQDLLSGLCDELERAGITVTRTGHVPRSGVAGELQNADIQVLPSRWQEPCALSLLEGMACGLAVVASRTGGTPEVLGDAGLFFSADDVHDLAAQLRGLLQNPARAKALGCDARKRACELTWQSTWMGLADKRAVSDGSPKTTASSSGARVRIYGGV